MVSLLLWVLRVWTGVKCKMVTSGFGGEATAAVDTEEGKCRSTSFICWDGKMEALKIFYLLQDHFMVRV